MEIEAAGIRIDVDDLAGEVEAGHALGRHGARVDFVYGHAAMGDNRLGEWAGAFHGHSHVLQQMHQPTPLLAGDLVDRRERRDAGELADYGNQRLRQQGIQRVLILLIGFSIKVGAMGK